MFGFKTFVGSASGFDAVRNVMAAFWHPGNGMFVKELDINRYLFQVIHEVDI